MSTVADLLEQRLRQLGVQRVYGAPLAGLTHVLVDDVADSGRTLKLVVQLLEAGGGEVRSVCLYRKPRTIIEPTYVWRSTDKWIMFPWSSEGLVPYPDGA